MIKTIVGNDPVRIDQILDSYKPFDKYNGEEHSPEEVCTPSLFQLNRRLVGYAKWSTSQRKKFVAIAAKDDSILVLVVLAQIGAKDPLVPYVEAEYKLPKDQRGWQKWVRQRCKEHNLNPSQQEVQNLLLSLGQDAWAIDTELERWALAQTSLEPLPLAQQAIWLWLDLLIQGKNDMWQALGGISEYHPLMLIGSLGQRLFYQTVRFSGVEPEVIEAKSYPWKIAQDAASYGWDMHSSRQWLKELTVLETKCKAGGKLEAKTEMIRWLGQMMPTHPSLNHLR
jgi:hypothetical protein